MVVSHYDCLEIWQPRYKDRTVLIAKYKVRPGKNYITFTKAKHLAGFVYYIEGFEIVKYPLTNNGKIACYEVPMDSLCRVV